MEESHLPEDIAGDRLLTTEEVAGLLQVSEAMVDILRKEDGLPFVKIRTAIRFRRVDVGEFVQNHLCKEAVG